MTKKKYKSSAKFIPRKNAASACRTQDDSRTVRFKQMPSFHTAS